MKKSSRPDPLVQPAAQTSRGNRSVRKKVEHWAFNLATESLFALGSGGAARRVAYRAADGNLRFLPL